MSQTVYYVERSPLMRVHIIQTASKMQARRRIVVRTVEYIALLTPILN